ncbi:hypothetical protein [Bartonella sp. MR110HLJHH]
MNGAEKAGMKRGVKCVIGEKGGNILGQGLFVLSDETVFFEVWDSHMK